MKRVNNKKAKRNGRQLQAKRYDNYMRDGDWEEVHVFFRSCC